MYFAEKPFSHSYRRSLHSELCSAELKLIIRQAPLLEGSLLELDAGRGTITADILAMKLASDDSFHAVNGCIVLNGDSLETRNQLRNLHLGECILAQGTLVPTFPPDPTQNFYNDYLLSQGIFHQFEVNTFEREPPQPLTALQVIRQNLRRIRIATAESLIRHFRSAENAQLVLALGLGMSEFIPRETRRRQMISGTIHVFAISGMHIGMVTLMFAFLLRRSGLPLRCQWYALGGFSTCYVLMTGSSISSIRALLMVWASLYASFRYRRTAWLNALGCAGGIALVMNPWQILDLGFLYTHLTVLVLLLGAPLVQTHLMLLAERKAWLPRELRPRHQIRLTQWFVGGLDASLLAWLGNLGISLHLQPQFSWGASLLNLPLGILIAIVLALCPLRLLLGAILPVYDSLWAYLLESVMQFTEAVAESGHHSAFEYTHPIMPLWAVGVYYIIFFSGLIALFLRYNDISSPES